MRDAGVTRKTRSKRGRERERERRKIQGEKFSERVYPLMENFWIYQSPRTLVSPRGETAGEEYRAFTSQVKINSHGNFARLTRLAPCARDLRSRPVR